MFSSGFSNSKLKTNLKLSINRLKLMEKKKTELAQKARREIADYIASGKDDRAKIRVEHIIREDYLVEAMELVELYCDMLLARYGLIQTMKTLDEGLAEAVSSIIWVAPRMSTDVPELKIVSDQLFAKYGKEYGRQARTNETETVNTRLMHKLKVEAPEKILVERYLIEIARSHNVAYEPDGSVLNGEQIEDLLVNLDENASIPGKAPESNNSKSGPPGGAPPPGGYGGGPPPAGFKGGPPPAGYGSGPPPGGFVGPPPGGFMGPPGGANSYPGPVHHDPSMAYPPPQAPQVPPSAPCMRGPPPLPSKPPVGSPTSNPSASAPPGGVGFPPPMPPAGYPQDPPRYSLAANGPVYPPPSQPPAPGRPQPAPRGAMPPPSAPGPEASIPELPSVPSDTLPSFNNNDGGGGDDLDFDELSKRFEDLKKKK